MPEFDVIGSIFNRIEEPIIIKADGNPHRQHMMFNWRVNRDYPVLTEAFDKTSLILVEAMNDFLMNSNKNEREVFVDEVFKALDEAGVEKIRDIKKGGVQIVVKVVKELMEMNKISKDTGGKLVKALVDVSSRNIGNLLFGGKKDD